MNKIVIILFLFIIQNLDLNGQVIPDNIIYVVDSIPVIEDPQPGNEILPDDIFEFKVMKNKDSLKLFGYEKMEGAIFIFTKEYQNRSEALKQIPSSKQMERKSGVYYFRGSQYSGKFIDYYYSGRKQGEGTLLDGKVDGNRKRYYQNGFLEVESNYNNGLKNGLDREYYENGCLEQKGEFSNGKEEGIWESYFPNGQVKQRSILKNGVIEGESTVYYSNGKILAVEVTKNGKTFPDKRLEKINQAMDKGHEKSKEGDYKSAIKNYSKAIELDSSNAEAYFARGTTRLNDFQFSEAILDFDKALKFEPYLEKALSNRAFARIRIYQFAGSRKLSENNDVTILASKDNPGIPEEELSIICNDLKQAIFLGDKHKMVLDAYKEFCGSK